MLRVMLILDCRIETLKFRKLEIDMVADVVQIPNLPPVAAATVNDLVEAVQGGQSVQLSIAQILALADIVPGDYVLRTGDSMLGPLNGVSPAAPANLTRMDYVDAQVATRLTAAQANLLYLPFSGGTVTGQIKGIAPLANEDLTRKDYVDGQVAPKISQAQADLLYLALAGGTVTGQINGITPTSPANLTRRDYVDTQVATKITQTQGDARYLQLTGGTVSGQIAGITPVGVADLTRKDYVDTKLPLAGGTLTGALLAAVGTEALPSITFAGDPDTGVWHPGTNAIGFSAGGVNRFTIDTTDISATLPLRLGDGGNVSPSYAFSSSTNTGMFLTSGTIAFGLAGTTAGRISTVNDAAAILQTRAFADARYAQLAGATMTGALLASVGTVALPGVAFTSDPNTGIYQIGDGQIGFSSNGLQRLEVNSTGISVVGTVLTNSGTAALPAHSFIAESNMGMYRATAARIGFATSGVSRMEIDSGGVYCTSRLEISQGAAADPGIRFISSANTGMFRIASNQIGFSLAGAEGARLSNANDNVNTLQTRAFADARYAPIASDARMKTNIEPMESMLATITALQPVTFDWIQPTQGLEGDEPQESKSPLRQYGMIAQDTAEVIPSSLAGQDESGFGIDPLTLIGILVKAVQELSAKVTALENAP
jgi:hypothetical protein